MAIKIIKHGDKPRIICKTCGCYFTYEKEDTVYEQYGINDYGYFVTCPDCGEKCFIDFIPQYR